MRAQEPHPFPPPLPNEIVMRETLHLPYPPDQLWFNLTDSDLFNRLLRLPSLRTYLDRDGDLNLPSAEMRVAGLRLSRQSDPLVEWEAPRWFFRRREFSNSPWKSIVSLQTVVEVSGGSEATYEMRFLPQWWFKPLFGFGAFYIRSRIKRFLSEVVGGAAHLQSIREVPQPRRSIDYTSVAASLADYEPDSSALSLLLEWLAAAEERDLARIKPLRLAREFGIDYRALLRILLAGNRAGLFDLNWELVCPSCRGVASRSLGLAGVKPGYHCDACRLDLRANFDEAIEVTFAPSPSLCRAEQRDYCYGFPARAPHVLVQMTLEAGERRRLDGAPEGGYFVWTLPQQFREELFVGGSGVITITDGGLEFSGSQQAGLEVRNDTSQRTMFQLQEKLRLAECLTAARLTALQDFRELSAAQLLAPDIQLGIRNLTILFTDLKGSTEMYSRVGDVEAFDRVRQHFEALFEVIRSHQGGVVKTIGDSVMAVFAEPANAARAAVEMRERISATGLILKVGIHSGPCIAITQNELLDYFGATVNLAARIEALSGGEVIFSRAFFDSSGVAAALGERGGEMRWEDAALKGILAPVRIGRWIPDLSG